MTLSLDRRDELLADRVLWGLSPDEERELGAFGADASDDGAGASWERAASATTVALLAPKIQPAPAHLVRKLETQAIGFVFERRQLRLHDLAERFDGRAAPSAPWAAWLVTAAALLVAALLWANRSADAPRAVPVAELRQAVLAASDALRLEWSPGPGAPTGDVVWSDARQEGYMRFGGLASNDPMQRQYQLWIFDGERDAARPVDGGVFDVPAGVTEVIVPIEAKLTVHRGQAFAVTVEKPGGVVVSAREQIVAVAGL